MKTKKAGWIKRMAVSVFAMGVVFWWAPIMPASTVHAESCTHENYDWVTLVKPTCHKPGKEVMICQDCEEILETESIPQTEHKGKWEKTREATCTRVGIRSYICKNCGFVIKTEELPTKSHKFVKTSSQSATCKSPKTIEKKCTVCGMVKTEIGSLSDRHKYGNWTIDSISVKGKTVKVTQSRMCTVCRNNKQVVSGTSAFSGKHDKRKYYYKYTKKTGRIVILCSECHKSVTGKISGGSLKFTKPKKNNAKSSSKGWKEVRK